ncbi:MAG: hypothetical protein ACI4CY_00820 [Candidatus Gastranaerophilaceae bacterium]
MRVNVRFSVSILALFVALPVFAEQSVFLRPNSHWLNFCTESARRVYSDNPEVVKASVVQTVDFSNRQILIETFSQGVGNVFVETSNGTKSFKINVVDKNTLPPADFVEIDLPDSGEI